MKQDSLLFAPMEINGMHLENRLVKSATYEAMASEDGSVTDQDPIWKIQHLDRDPYALGFMLKRSFCSNQMAVKTQKTAISRIAW